MRIHKIHKARNDWVIVEILLHPHLWRGSTLAPELSICQFKQGIVEGAVANSIHAFWFWIDRWQPVRHSTISEGTDESCNSPHLLSCNHRFGPNQRQILDSAIVRPILLYSRNK